MWFILGVVTGPGWSAEQEYRSRRRRRRLVRAATGLAGGSAAAGAVRVTAVGHPAGHLRALAVLWGVAAVAGLLLRWPGYGGRDVQRWQRGAAGERRTGLVLDRLKAPRWSVRHDLRVPGSRANVDHVLVGRSGVWVVDTKTTRAPVRAGWGRVRFGDRRLDTSGVRWEAEVVADRLAAAAAAPGGGGWRESDVRRVVRPIVAVHGFGLGRRGGRSGGVRVVAAEDLVRRVRRGRRLLRRAEVADLAAALDRAFPGGGDVGPRGYGRKMAGSFSRTGGSDV